MNNLLIILIILQLYYIVYRYRNNKQLEEKIKEMKKLIEENKINEM